MNNNVPRRVFDFDGDRAQKLAKLRITDSLRLEPGQRYLIEVAHDDGVLLVPKLLEVRCDEISPSATYVMFRSPEWGQMDGSWTGQEVIVQPGRWFKVEGLKILERLDADSYRTWQPDYNLY